MTSVKRFRIQTEPTAETLGRGAFVFTDAYSVFDWGQMPDEIPGKGQSLCTMGATTFERLEDAGIATHYLGVGGPEDPVSLDACERPPDEMAIDLTHVPDLPFDNGAYDYDAFYANTGSHYLIPLEIVFRNQVPIGSSLRNRSVPEDHDLSFAEWPEEAVELAAPIIEFSTKFEESDRYLTTEEADRIAGVASIEDLRAVAREVNTVINQHTKDVGLTHLDGKIECLYHDGSIKIADVTGTLDENRFAFNGHQLSKEVLRQYYARTDPDWVDAVTEAKDRAKREGIADWRDLCTKSPETLPSEMVELASDMYRAGANTYLDRQWFDVPPLHVVSDRLRAVTE